MLTRTFTIYLFARENPFRFMNNEEHYEFRESFFDETIHEGEFLYHQQEVIISVPDLTDDIARQSAIASIDQQKSAERRRHLDKMASLEDKLSDLLCLPAGEHHE